MSDIMNEIMSDMGISDPEPLTNEARLYDYWVNTKPHPKIYNCQYWLKHELYVYKAIKEKAGYIISKPWKQGEARVEVTNTELSRALLRYYFNMVTLTSFENERASEQGKLVDREKFLDLVMGCPAIKNLINNPYQMI